MVTLAENSECLAAQMTRYCRAWPGRSVPQFFALLIRTFLGTSLSDHDKRSETCVITNGIWRITNSTNESDQKSIFTLNKDIPNRVAERSMWTPDRLNRRGLVDVARVEQRVVANH
jgi:hypothetical protein